MSLIKITDLTNQFGISSRSLRYYEQIGLIQSVRQEYDKYRLIDVFQDYYFVYYINKYAGVFNSNIGRLTLAINYIEAFL